ncbi:MAG: family 16 glycosylhydrolase [Micromonosporaceae bacterium]
MKKVRSGIAVAAATMVVAGGGFLLGPQMAGAQSNQGGDPSPSATASATASPTASPTTSPTASPTESPTEPGDDTAADRHNWGTPLPGSDEFNYTGGPDREKWGVYGDGGTDNCWPGHAGNGRRCADANHVADGFLRQTGEANGDSAGIASKVDLKYGRWEVRARMSAEPGASGNPYHPVLITWPQSNQWPEGAEYDFLEVNIGDDCAGAFLHYPNHEPKRQEHAEKCPTDLTQWHNYGFEWTEGGLVGYIDGVEWFRFDSDCIQCAPGPMHQTIQLDNFFGSGMQQAYLDVDWSRVYQV